MAGSYDGTFSCPACQKRGVLPENRQCPACGIFVDKVTDEFLLRRKMMEQERGKIEFQQAKSLKDSDKRAREMMEAAIRAKVREDLEKEYGIKEKRGLFQGSSGLFRGIGLIGLMAIAFFGGRGFSLEGLPGSKPAAGKEAATTPTPQTMTANSLEKAAQGPGAEAGEAGGAATAAGDPDIDDPLIQAAGAGPTATVPKQTKLILTAEFARIQAELGQSARAREVLKAATASLNPATEPEAAAAIRSAELRAQAWAIQRREAGAPGKASEELENKILALPNPVERTQIPGQVAVKLIVSGDLALARVLQGLGRYAEAEALLQRVGGYLF